MVTMTTKCHLFLLLIYNCDTNGMCYKETDLNKNTGFILKCVIIGISSLFILNVLNVTNTKVLKLVPNFKKRH